MEPLSHPPDVFPSSGEAMLAATLPATVQLPAAKQYTSLSHDESSIEAHCSCGASASIVAGDSMAGRVLRQFIHEHAACN